LNCAGGEILIGVDDRDNVVGVDNPDAAQLKIVDRIRNNIRPQKNGVCMVIEWKEVELLSLFDGDMQNSVFCRVSRKGSGVSLINVGVTQMGKGYGSKAFRLANKIHDNPLGNMQSEVRQDLVKSTACKKTPECLEYIILLN